MSELPLVALPELLKLLDHFDKALAEASEKYEKTADKTSFQKIINTLGDDLATYMQSVDAWGLLDATPEQKRELIKIENKISTSQQKLNKAIALLKP